MPSYNLPSFPLLSTSSSTATSPESSAPIPASSTRPMHAPIPIRAAFVPIPVPQHRECTGCEQGGERPRSPQQKRERKALKEIQMQIQVAQSEKKARKVDELKQGRMERAKRRDEERSEEEEEDEGAGPDTPTASPDVSRSGSGLGRSRGRSGSSSGGNHTRAPSEGASRRLHSHSPQKHPQPHRRSSSLSTISFASPPSPLHSASQYSPTPSPTQAKIHPFIIAQRCFAPLRSSPLSPSPPAPPRGRSPSPSTPCHPRPPLSRRYTRPLAAAALSSRIPAQQGSFPRFSSSPLSFFTPSSSSSCSSSTSSDSQKKLLESLILRTLIQRLSDKLVKASLHSLGGEKAGLGGLKAGREMAIWAVCVRVREEERRRVLAPFCVVVPEVERLGEARVGAGKEIPNAPAPLDGLPGEEFFAVVQKLKEGRNGTGKGREREKGRGHSREYSSPLPPSPPTTPPPPSHGKPSHSRRLSSLSLPSLVSGALPSLRRSLSSPSPSSSSPALSPTSITGESRPAPPRRSYSLVTFDYTKEREDDLPLSIRSLLPSQPGAVVLRPMTTAPTPSSSTPSMSPTSLSFNNNNNSNSDDDDDPPFYPPSPSSFSPRRPVTTLHRRLPTYPPTIPLAPPQNSDRRTSLVPSEFTLRTPTCLSPGIVEKERGTRRSGRGLEDWSKIGRDREVEVLVGVEVEEWPVPLEATAG
ncbi:hypothetical protein JCM11641_007726 [Rhodosporidiobolus odoratus]